MVWNTEYKWNEYGTLNNFSFLNFWRIVDIR